MRFPYRICYCFLCLTLLALVYFREYQDDHRSRSWYRTLQNNITRYATNIVHTNDATPIPSTHLRRTHNAYPGLWRMLATIPHENRNRTILPHLSLDTPRKCQQIHTEDTDKRIFQNCGNRSNYHRRGVHPIQDTPNRITS